MQRESCQFTTNVTYIIDNCHCILLFTIRITDLTTPTRFDTNYTAFQYNNEIYRGINEKKDYCCSIVPSTLLVFLCGEWFHL